MGGAVFPPCCLIWDQTMVEVMKIMAPPSTGPMHALLHSVPPTLQQATADPCLCRRLLDTHRQVWVSLLWGHCSFLLGPGAHKVFFFFFLNFIYLFILLYNIVLVLPYINMHPPRVYMCSPSWTPCPLPSPYHPSGSSQCTLPVSCIEPGLRFVSYMILYMF